MRRSRLVPVVLAALALALVTIAALHLRQRAQLDRLEWERSAVRLRVDRLGEVVARVEAYAAAQREHELQSRLLTAADADARRRLEPALLVQLADWCRSRELQVARIRLRGGFLEVTGRTSSRRTVNRLGDRLEERALVQEFGLRRFDEAVGAFTFVASLPGKRVRR